MEVLSLCLTPSEKARIGELAASHQMSKAEYLRHVVRAVLGTSADRPALSRVPIELWFTPDKAARLRELAAAQGLELNEYATIVLDLVTLDASLVATPPTELDLETA